MLIALDQYPGEAIELDELIVVTHVAAANVVKDSL